MSTLMFPEHDALNDADRILLDRWHLPHDMVQPRVRRVVFIGRFQRELNARAEKEQPPMMPIIVDGRWGPRSQGALRRLQATRRHDLGLFLRIPEINVAIDAAST